MVEGIGLPYQLHDTLLRTYAMDIISVIGVPHVIWQGIIF
jgi:hypothetical protein